MAKGTLYNKVWDAHTVAQLANGQTQLFVGLHLLHEITSPQAFDMLRERGMRVACPERTFATVDHIMPTDGEARPFADARAEAMISALEANTREADVTYFGPESGRQGIVHVVAPELGLTRPGMTVVCGDSHTSTHGAFGALAFGIGTSQVRDVLATQCIAMEPLKVRRIEVEGTLAPGVTPKDVALFIINRLGVEGGIGHVYEYGGEVFDAMSMEGRMTVCNMSVEGGARAGYVNPDAVTFDYLRGREYAPAEQDRERAERMWRRHASDDDAVYDDRVVFAAEDIAPMLTWGITPAQSVFIGEPVPPCAAGEDGGACEVHSAAVRHMRVAPGQDMRETAIDVAFIGSCTNGRISDLRAAADVARGRRVAPGVRALVVPGSMRVRDQAVAEGLDRVFVEAGFEWREPGCSMCIGMNADKLNEGQLCASSSNRNFIGRQGSAGGRTLLMSPAMVAAAAIRGRVSDAREFLSGENGNG
ncbi:MAG TPA: 3-isopropylmalate dehydratase large subunit [Gallionellaceae bacterium]|nr:3-isopropylmalate dehydratase large subunit [Gallionellaceae bacterium]